MGREVARLLREKTSEFALQPIDFSLDDLCDRLYDPSTAQPIRTSKGQKSAWVHWEKWCRRNGTKPWRLLQCTTDTQHHRESALQAGFLRFTHVRQSAKPRNGRKAALVSSAVKVLCHIRKAHKDRSYPMVASGLVNVEARRLMFEYKSKHGVHDMIPNRKEPFTRPLVEEHILGATMGLNLGFARLDWTKRHGRSLRGLAATLCQTGLRKAEVSVHRAGDQCNADCMSRAALRWFLRGHFHASASAPPAHLRDLQPGDFAVLTPCCSKSDPFDMVWGGNPIWLPYQPNELLCACTALADIELHDPLGARSADESALFTTDEGLPFSESQLDAALRTMLLDRLPPATAKLYTWHSGRIFLATMLLEAGATHAEIRALCRWQTDESIAIYARLNSLKYKSLLDGAMRARVTTARTNNLANALPFLDADDIYAAAARQISPSDLNLNADVHPDDDADDDVENLDDATTSTPDNGGVHAEASTPPRRTRKRVRAALDAGEEIDIGTEAVAIALHDPLELAGTSVMIPDAAWPECADSHTVSSGEIRGPILADPSSYVVTVDDFSYVFPVHDLIRFLPTARRTRVRARVRTPSFTPSLS